MSLWNRHQVFEKNSIVLTVGVLGVVAIGGIVEIAPLFYLKSTVEKVEGVRPYTPLELAGRNIYIREGCYNCHSQMVRPLRDEVERYGHYSLAAESVFDHPFQWGSKRTGPDLARVGGRYSDEWQVTHLVRPKSVVPGSIMPGYPFLQRTALDYSQIDAHLRTLRRIGVPYSDEQIANARSDVEAQTNPDDPASAGFRARWDRKPDDPVQKHWPAANVRKFDATQKAITEMDALVAYLQVLGTMVDFTAYNAKASIR